MTSRHHLALTESRALLDVKPGASLEEVLDAFTRCSTRSRTHSSQFSTLLSPVQPRKLHGRLVTLRQEYRIQEQLLMSWLKCYIVAHTEEYDLSLALARAFWVIDRSLGTISTSLLQRPAEYGSEVTRCLGLFADDITRFLALVQLVVHGFPDKDQEGEKVETIFKQELLSLLIHVPTQPSYLLGVFSGILGAQPRVSTNTPRSLPPTYHHWPSPKILVKQIEHHPSKSA